MIEVECVLRTAVTLCVARPHPRVLIGTFQVVPSRMPERRNYWSWGMPPLLELPHLLTRRRLLQESRYTLLLPLGLRRS